MKKLLNKLGFRRMDEMEKQINFRAQGIAYIFLILALFIWTTAEGVRGMINKTTFNLLPCLLLSTASLIHNISQQIMIRNAVKDDEESFESSPLFKIILTVFVVIAVCVTIGSFVVIMGVRL